MTRHTSFVLVIAAIMFILGLPVVTYIQASEYQWTSLDGPYWVNGIDVAYGMSSNNQAWHRYLIGSNENVRKLFRWRETDSKWFEWDELASANKLISYKNAGSGNFAVCSAYDDNIYVSSDGGIDWNRKSFPSNFNRHFSSVEIVNMAQNPGQTILVGCEFNGSLATTYYTEDYGQNWAKLGAPMDPLDNLTVLDLETLPDGATPPTVIAATSEGLYKHTGSWNTPWTLLPAFSGLEVRALESIDNISGSRQVAAVNDNGTFRLYVTENAWSNYAEIRVGNEPFNKEVNDLSALGYAESSQNHTTVYAATTMGIFLLHFPIGNPAAATQVDLRDHYAPMNYDKNVVAIDYFDIYPGLHNEYIMASTPFNVYRIDVERDEYEGNCSLVSLNIGEIVQGTFKCQVAHGQTLSTK